MGWFLCIYILLSVHGLGIDAEPSFDTCIASPVCVWDWGGEIEGRCVGGWRGDPATGAHTHMVWRGGGGGRNVHSWFGGGGGLHE